MRFFQVRKYLNDLQKKLCYFDNIEFYQQYEPKTEIFGDIKSNTELTL